MKKIIILILLISIILVGSFCSQKDTIWITFKTPYLLDIGIDGYGNGFDFGANILDVKIEDSLNQDNIKIKKVGDTSLNWIYEVTKDTGIVDENIINFAGQPMFLHRGEIKIKIYKNELIKLKGKIQELRKVGKYDFQNDIVEMNSIQFIIQDIYTGEMVEYIVPCEENSLRNTLRMLNNTFATFNKERKELYFKNNIDMLKKVNFWIENDNTDKDKANTIVNIIAEEIEGMTEEVQQKATQYLNNEYNYMVSVDYVWKAKEGYCRNIAYTIKTMLDLAGIKNKIVMGYIKNSIHQELNGTFHMLNAIWDEEQQKWLWLDGTTGGFNDSRMYTCLEEHAVLKLRKK